MAYERNTTEGIRSWLSAEVTSPGWNSASIAKSLTEDVMTIIVQDFNEFDSRIKQGILLSTLCMRKGDLMALGDGLDKVFQLAMNDSDDFVRTSAHVLKNYPNKQVFDLNINTWSNSFKSLLQSIGSAIKANGFNFHPPEDMILQPNARIEPNYPSSTYGNYKSTHVQHFNLSSNKKDIISSEERHARFKELVEMEERSEQAEAQAAQVVAQKRAGAELINSKAKRVASPTNSAQNPFPFPPHHRNSVSFNPGSMVPNAAAAAAAGRPVPPRSFSLGSVPNAAPSGSSSLFTKRPARPTRPLPSSGGGGLFIKQNKPAGGQRTIQRTTTPGTLNNNLPRGLQRIQKTQMLDFSAATEIEQNTANAVKKAQDDIKAKAEAKKQEALDKKKKAADEKREREEAKRQQRAMAKEAKEAAAAKKLAQEEQAAEEMLPKSPTSAPNSPKTPTSPFSPKIKQEHVFAIPALPSHHSQHQEQQQRLSPKTSPKTPPSEKLTTF